MADPYFSNVVLLMHLDGANGSASFIDVTGRHSFTAAGGAVLTTAQFKFGTASLDSVGTDIDTPTGTDWQFGSGQFTVECWVRPTSVLSGVRSLIAYWRTGSFGWELGFNGNTLNFFYSTIGSDNPVVSAAYTPTQNAWVHIAADRDTSNVLRVYANGTVIASATVSSSFFASASPLYVGNDGTGVRRFAGQIDELRVTKGIARYGGAFTAPTAPFDDSGLGDTGTLSATETQDSLAFAGRIVPSADTGILHSTEAQDMATMTGNVTQPLALPPGVPNVPQGDVVALAYPATQDYPRLVFSAPRFEVVAIADIIQPSVLEAVEGMLPSLVPPYVTAAANAAVQSLAVQLVGSTMTGPLMLSPPIPTAPSMAASMQYVQSMIATVIPEVPPTPVGQAWARQTGQWIPLAGGGTVTNIATGAGLTGGPITATGTISMANMAANSIKGNNTGAVAAPTDIPAGTVLTMIGGAPLNSPVFTGSPSLPTGTAAITQTGGTANTTVATTQFVANSLGSYAPIASPVFTGAPSLPTGSIGVTQTAGNSSTALATTAFVAGAITTATGNYLPLTGGRLSGGLASGPAATAVPGLGALTLNANTVAPAAPPTASNFIISPADGSGGTIHMDGYGTSSPVVRGRAARGTSASPTPVQSGDVFLNMVGMGRGATAYAGGSYVAIEAAQTWTDTIQGTQIICNTTPLGATAGVNSLVLQGNLATFSGTVSIPNNSMLYLNGTTAGVPGRIYSDGSNMICVMPAAANFIVQNQAGTAEMFVDSTGNFTIGGATATKASGTTWANPSSRDIKQDIQPYTGSLGDLLDLTPVTYRFSNDSGFSTAETHIGLIHDECSHMPEMHRTLTIGVGDDAREVDGLDCSAITFCLINAVKELSARLTAVEGRA